MNKKIPFFVLPVIIGAQFCCTSLWFAGNAVMSDLMSVFDLNQEALGTLTSSVQFGFIIGTLFFAVFSVADRFSPSIVFFSSSILGAFFNLGIIWEGNTLLSLVLMRFATGFFLAGIYPVGMKIASDYYDAGLGKSLSLLVGALVLGTGFPHLINSVPTLFEWRNVIQTTSLAAVLGGLSILFIKDGPYRKLISRPHFSSFTTVFSNLEFRKAAFGYFGHMWELYTFWAFVPLIIVGYNTFRNVDLNVSLISFTVIGIGFLGCVLGGMLSERYGSSEIARVSLATSGICCILLPYAFLYLNPLLFLLFLLIWGMSVIADSPLFSTLIAQNTVPELKGTALTIVNSIGFAISILSIQLMTFLTAGEFWVYHYLVLAIGPGLGLIYLKKPKYSTINY